MEGKRWFARVYEAARTGDHPGGRGFLAMSHGPLGRNYGLPCVLWSEKSS